MAESPSPPGMRRRLLAATGLGVAGVAASSPDAGPGAAPKLQLKVHWMVTGGVHRDAVLRLLGDFAQAHPQVTVLSRELDQTPYKEALLGSLQAQPAAADVMTCFGGERLRELARQGLFAPLDSIALEAGWQHNFSPALSTEARLQDTLYGLPLATYVWGFFYRRSAFAKWGLQPPRTWPDLLALCAALRQRQVAPFVVGAQDGWALAGWFDQLNLRLHGRDFHLALLRGQLPFTDARVGATFTAWRELIAQGAFLDRSPELNWRAAVPYVSRGLAGLMLSGGFAASQFPVAVRQDLGWCPFPAPNPVHARLQEAPLDVLVIPANAANKGAAALLLKFAAQAAVQQQFNASLGTLAAHRQAKVGSEPWLQSSAQALVQATGLTQFFDRDASAAFSVPAMGLLQRFFRDPTQQAAVQQALEALRQGQQRS